VAARYPLKAAKGIESLALDEANNRVFVGFRHEPRIVVLDQESGKELTSVAIPEGIDDMFFDAKAKRIYASCGSGFVAAVRQVDADRYELVAKVATSKGAKRCFCDEATARLCQAVPRQEGKEGPAICVYQASPQRAGGGGPKLQVGRYCGTWCRCRRFDRSPTPGPQSPRMRKAVRTDGR
jgi:hypothetical protein